MPLFRVMIMQDSRSIFDFVRCSPRAHTHPLRFHISSKRNFPNVRRESLPKTAACAFFFFFTPPQLRNDNRKRCERGSPPCSAGADLRLLVWRSVDKVTVVGSLTEEASLSCSLIVVDSFRIYIHIRLFACASSVWVPRACWPFSDLFDCLIVDYGSRFSVISSCRRVHVFDLRCTLPRPCLIDYGVRFAYSACKEILR